MNTKSNIENRLYEIERDLIKVKNESKKKPKLPKLILTAALIIEKLWRTIKHYILELDL